MNRGDKGKRPFKGRGHPPQGEFIALGSKAPSKTQEVPELKHLPSLKPLSGSSLKKTTTSLPDRKRDCPSPLQPLRIAKQRKTSSPHSPNVSIDIESSLKTSSSSLPVPSIPPIDVSADELESKVMKADENGDRTRVDGYLTGGLKVLRMNRSKPDLPMCLSLFCLVKRRSHLFRSHRITEFLTSLLKRDSSVTLKGARPSPAVPIIACNILLCAFQDEQNWPESFIKVYVEDSLGDRIWVENERCRLFVENLLTAFETKLPPRTVVGQTATEGNKDSTNEDKISSSITSPKFSKIDDEDVFMNVVQCKQTIPSEEDKVSSRYESAIARENVHSYIVDLLNYQLSRRQLVDHTTRNLLRLMSAACGISDVRLLASQRLETWLQNPKLNRPANELLMSVALNCHTHSLDDIEVISNIIKMRLKTKQLAAHYITCIRVLVEQHEENLGTLIKHVIYNELSQTRNPNNMSMFAALFQFAPDKAAKELAGVFQELLTQREDYLRAIRALLREIVRSLRHDLNFVALCRGLMTERNDVIFQDLATPIKERMFASLTDIISATTLLSITPTVRDAIMAFKLGDTRDIKVIQEFQKNVALIQEEVTSWFYKTVPHMFPISASNFSQSLSKVFFMEPPESYTGKDSWPSESERTFLLSVVTNIPVMDDTLTRVSVIGLSPELPLDAQKALKFIDILVQRAAVVKSGINSMEINRLRFIDAILDLCAYHHPPNILLPSGYEPPLLAIGSLYWTAWIIILLVAAFNPTNIGEILWQRYPTLKCLVEMAMTNNFVFPPPTMIENQDHLEELHRRETQIAAAEKDDILLFETHLAAASSGKTITEESSLLLRQLISLAPEGPVRKPPQYILDQLKRLNATVGIGKRFCCCRSPDFLLEIIQRQSAAKSRPWLADLVLSSQESLDVLPVQCLCEFLLQTREDGDSAEERNEKYHETVRQVIRRLHDLLFGDEACSASTSETLESFMYRLHSRSTKDRNSAVKALRLIFMFGKENHISYNDPSSWLLVFVPTLPYFHSVLNSLTIALRKACTEELKFERLQSYIIFLSLYSSEESMLDVSKDLGELLTDRSTVLKSILRNDMPKGMQTHESLLKIFNAVLTKALETVSSEVVWDNIEKSLFVRWSKNTMHSGKATTISSHIIQASLVLLTFGPSQASSQMYYNLLNTWCPADGNVKAFLPNTGEEVEFIPGWLRLKMICSNVERLEDAAISSIEPSKLVDFLASYGIPVRSASKMLKSLDSFVQTHPHLIDEVIAENKRISDLIVLHQSRGASGGEIIHSFLNGSELKISSRPFREELLPPLRSSHVILEEDSVIVIKGLDSLEEIKHAVGKIFPFSKSSSSTEQSHLAFLLQKKISNDVSHVHKGVNFSRTVSEKLINVLIKILKSSESAAFSNIFFNSPRFAHPLLRILIARETILEKQGDYSAFPDLVDLLSKHCKDGPISSLITKYIVKSRTRHRRIVKPVSPSAIRFVLNKVESGASLTDSEVKDAITALKSLKNHEKMPEVKEFMPVLTYLFATRSHYIDEFLRVLIAQIIPSNPNESFSQQTSQFIQDLIGLIQNRSSNSSRAGNGAIMDWLPILDPSIVNISPLKQRELLFGSTLGINGDNDAPPQGMLLLVLLIHSGSWGHLQDTLDWLLNQHVVASSVNPTSVLCFFESCLIIPHLWQGRDTKSAQGIETSFYDDVMEPGILSLSSEQIRCLVEYILKEAELSKQKIKDCAQSSSEFEDLFESRVSLLLRCCKGKLQHLRTVIEKIQSSNCWSKEILKQFLVKLYLYLPELSSWIKDPDCLVDLKRIIAASHGKFDGLFHRMISILNDTESGKTWEHRIDGVVLLCKKMAICHPAHVLRYLPVISSLVRGRTHLTSKQFYGQNHFLFFTHILGLLESLRPHIFDTVKFIEDGLNDALDSFLDLVLSQCLKQKERASFVTKLVEFLQQYLTHNPSGSLKYLHTKMDALMDLSLDYPDLPCLNSILAVLSVPRNLSNLDSSTETSNAGSSLLDVAPSPSLMMPPCSTPWSPSQIEPFLQKITSNQPISEVLKVLNDLDETSKRRVDILQYFLTDLVRITKDLNETCRDKAHCLIARHLKHNPRDSKLIKDGLVECLCSSDPGIVTSAAKVLPEICILAAEYCEEIFEKVFMFSTKKLAKVGLSVTKTFQMFNFD
ncbi:integrator complex subunit 1-like [Xenia sp. Carnegie-2017]|uniref:integrator complex subunit 1-like n=1 Tax=Xenia sp. Carnegie-2017 TaxID=2897299 RepID=UPI001F03ED89|nr:integrator complex subunit 1-like [Xenia sp. Carnegie-2017]